MKAPPVDAAWQRFWFEPHSTSTLAVVRIAFGLVMTAWTLSLLPYLTDLFGAQGIFPDHPPSADLRWGILTIDGDALLVGSFVVLLLASLSLVVGFQTRIAAVLVWIGILSFTRRNPFAFNSGDGLLRIIALYLMLAPSGAALSVDRWRRARDRFWEFPRRAPWALRLIQLQLSVVYLSTVWAKARGVTWNDGTAVTYAFRLEDLERFPLPGFLAESLLLVNLMTFGTLAVEAGIGILIWNRALRPYVVAVGILFHLGIDYQIRVGFFAYAMFVCYLAFTPPARMDAVLLAVRDRLAATRFGRRIGTTYDRGSPGRPAEGLGAGGG